MACWGVTLYCISILYCPLVAKMHTPEGVACLIISDVFNDGITVCFYQACYFLDLKTHQKRFFFWGSGVGWNCFMASPFDVFSHGTVMEWINLVSQCTRSSRGSSQRRENSHTLTSGLHIQLDSPNIPQICSKKRLHHLLENPHHYVSKENGPKQEKQAVHAPWWRCNGGRAAAEVRPCAGCSAALAGSSPGTAGARPSAATRRPRCCGLLPTSSAPERRAPFPCSPSPAQRKQYGSKITRQFVLKYKYTLDIELSECLSHSWRHLKKAY